MHPESDISIVISSYNRENKILQTLQSLFKNDLSSFRSIELIIIDDGSPKPVKNILPAPETIASNIHLKLVEQKNAGIGATRNRGYREAKFPVVLFLDDDIIVQEKTVTDMFESLRQCNGAVVFGSYPFVSHNTPSLEKFARHLFNYNDITTTAQFKKVDAITSGLLCVNKEKLGFAGDFYNNDLSVPAAEEHEIIFRFHTLGIPIYHATHITAGHNHFLTLNWLVQQQYKYGLATAEAFVKKPAITAMPKFATLKQTLDFPGKKIIKNIMASGFMKKLLLFAAKTMEKVFPGGNHNRIFGVLTSAWFRAGYNEGVKRFAN